MGHCKPIVSTSKGRLSAVMLPYLSSLPLKTATGRAQRADRSQDAIENWPVIGLMLSPLLVWLIIVTYTIGPALAGGRGDELSYLGYATNLTHGYYADLRSPVAAGYLWHGPGFPILLAPLIAMHLPLDLLRLTGPVFLYGALVIVFRLIRLYTSRRLALAATVGVSLYPPFYTVLGYLRVEPLSVFLFTLTVYFMVKSMRGTPRAHRWAGLAFGWLALSRVEYGWMLVGTAIGATLWLLWRRHSRSARQLAVASALAMAVCAPWLIYTYSLTSRPLYWGNSGGLSLYWMSDPAPGNTGDWRPLAVSSGPQAPAPPGLGLGEISRLKPMDQDPRLLHLAVTNILHHPRTYLTNLVNNTSRLVFDFPYSGRVESDRALLYALPNALLLGALLLAVGIMSVRRRNLRPEFMVILCAIVAAFAIHVPIAAYPRFVLPLVPAVAWLIVAILTGYLRIESEPAAPLSVVTRRAA